MIEEQVGVPFFQWIKENENDLKEAGNQIYKKLYDEQPSLNLFIAGEYLLPFIGVLNQCVEFHDLIIHIPDMPYFRYDEKSYYTYHWHFRCINEKIYESKSCQEQFKKKLNNLGDAIAIYGFSVQEDWTIINIRLCKLHDLKINKNRTRISIIDKMLEPEPLLILQ